MRNPRERGSSNRSAIEENRQRAYNGDHGNNIAMLERHHGRSNTNAYDYRYSTRNLAPQPPDLAERRELASRARRALGFAGLERLRQNDAAQLGERLLLAFGRFRQRAGTPV